MTVAGVLLAAGGSSRFAGPGNKLRADLGGRPVFARALDAVLAAGFDEVVVVVGDDPLTDLVPAGVSVVPSVRWEEGQSHSLQAAIAHCRERGHKAVVVGLADQPLVGAAAWIAVAAATSRPVAVASFAGARRPPTRIGESMWSRLPTDGDEGARALLRQLGADEIAIVPVPGDPSDVDTIDALESVRQRLADREAVARLLGREPQGRFDVVVRDPDGQPRVIRNDPLLDDGRPMPTLYWLCGRREQMLVGRLESLGGVRRAEREVGLDAIADAHDRYRKERDRFLVGRPSPEHRPSGGVGGTRVGVKCLHAHYAWWLAGGDDPVGAWVHDHLSEVERDDWPSTTEGADP